MGSRQGGDKGGKLWQKGKAAIVNFSSFGVFFFLFEKKIVSLHNFLTLLQ